MALQQRSRSVECVRPETELQTLNKAPRSRSCRKKSVQWCHDLEQVRYFVPRKDKAGSVKKKINQIRRRAATITDRPLKTLSLTATKTAWRKFRCISRQSMSLDTGLQTFDDYNRQWDLLFEMYTSSAKVENEIADGAGERTP